jgi:hypothetical protein
MSKTTFRPRHGTFGHLWTPVDAWDRFAAGEDDRSGGVQAAEREFGARAEEGERGGGSRSQSHITCRGSVDTHNPIRTMGRKRQVICHHAMESRGREWRALPPPIQGNTAANSPEARQFSSLRIAELHRQQYEMYQHRNSDANHSGCSWTSGRSASCWTQGRKGRRTWNSVAPNQRLVNVYIVSS